MTEGLFYSAWVIVRYELRQALRSVLTWAALPCLAVIPPIIGVVFGGSIQVSGHPVGEQFRQSYAVAIGLTAVFFLATLYVLCLCLERLGSSYLRHNDILVLARSVSRSSFWLGKLSGIVIPGIVYTFLGLLLVVEEIWRHGGPMAPNILTAQFPMSLGLITIAVLFLALRNAFGNFIIFFVFLLVLPILFVGDLWSIYAGVLREAKSGLGFLSVMPQLGGLHALALGLGHPSFWRPDAVFASVNTALWSAAGLIVGLLGFRRKRL
jgi:hypothetical protein